MHTNDFSPEGLPKTLAHRVEEIWMDGPRHGRLRNPRQKEAIHRVTLAALPDLLRDGLDFVNAFGEWSLAHLRVPFNVEFEGERPVFATRCHREAVAVKLRWG